MYGCESWTIKKAEHQRIDAFELWCWRRLLRVPLTARRFNHCINPGRSVLAVHWKDWCWSWNSNTLAAWCKELTHWKRARCWERLRTGGEGDDRGWDGWMASLTQWTWVWVGSGSWWWTGRPGVLRFMGSERVEHDWVTDLTDWCSISQYPVSITNKWLSSNLAGESHWSNTVSELNTLNYLCCFLTQPKEERKGKQSIILKTELERS